MASIVCFHKEEEQKKLFFQINNFFNSVKEEYEINKVTGLYVIYKDDLCLYVGQSSNIPSRIATHLKGKYENCSKIEIFIDTEELGDLIKYEKQMIKKLKPIENILADYTESIEVEYNPCYENPSQTLINDKHELAIFYDFHMSIYTCPNILSKLKSEIEDVEHFISKGN